jgi:hypothetical protein
MKKRIVDEFSHLPISRQRKYQLRMERDNRCTECGARGVYASRCLKHMVKARERLRKKIGLKRRYFNTLSYRLEEEAAQLALKGVSPRTRTRKLQSNRRRVALRRYSG